MLWSTTRGCRSPRMSMIGRWSKCSKRMIINQISWRGKGTKWGTISKANRCENLTLILLMSQEVSKKTDGSQIDIFLLAEGFLKIAVENMANAIKKIQSS